MSRRNKLLMRALRRFEKSKRPKRRRAQIYRCAKVFVVIDGVARELVERPINVNCKYKGAWPRNYDVTLTMTAPAPT